MFSLIISIIAIALVAALALASIYYGGSAFQEGSADAEASTAVNQGQQIQAAVTMAKINEDWKDTGGSETTLAALTEYLKETPKLREAAWNAPVLTAGNERTYVAASVVNEDVCKKIEEKGNASYDPTTALPTAIAAGQPFGCVNADIKAVKPAGYTGNFTAYYKL